MLPKTQSPGEVPAVCRFGPGGTCREKRRLGIYVDPEHRGLPQEDPKPSPRKGFNGFREANDLGGNGTGRGGKFKRGGRFLVGEFTKGRSGNEVRDKRPAPGRKKAQGGGGGNKPAKVGLRGRVERGPEGREGRGGRGGSKQFGDPQKQKK